MSNLFGQAISAQVAEKKAKKRAKTTNFRGQAMKRPRKPRIGDQGDHIWEFDKEKGR